MKILLITNPFEKSTIYICQQLQNAWNAKVENDLRIPNQVFLEESDYFKIIDSRVKYNSLNENFIPEIIFIVPELMWENDDVNEGYTIARELITHSFKSEFVQVAFLSVLDRKSLLNIVDTRNKSFAEAFPHICLLEDECKIKFEYYSELHHKLIKYLAISDHGRLQKIGHEMSSLKSNIAQNTSIITQNKEALLRQLEELTLFQAWTTQNLSDILIEIRSSEESGQLEQIAKSIESVIEEIRIKIPKDKDEIEGPNHKSNYTMLIIEDEIDYRSFFYETLSKFYQEVYPNALDEYPASKNSKYKLQNFNIADTREYIKEHCKNYQIILLDLLFKGQEGNWLDFNGLDLFRIVRKENPYAVIRIITSLPRGIVSKVVESIITESDKPNTDQVFTKKYGKEALKDSIIESIDKINAECREKAKAKTTLKPFPKEGVFKWPGIYDLMEDLLYSRITYFNEYKSQALRFFDLYKNNQLNIDTPEWNGQLIKPAKKDTVTDSYFLGKLTSILSHRLIALNEAIENDDNKVFYSKYKDILKLTTNITTIDKQYFQTKLGFNGSEFKEPSGEDDHFKIDLKNLFPYEVIFITEKRSIKEESELENTLDDTLNRYFKEILIDLDTYENWDELNLDYNPYENIEADIDNLGRISIDRIPDLTLKHLKDFLKAIIENYNNEYIEKIIPTVQDYAPDFPNIHSKVIEELLRTFFEK